MLAPSNFPTCRPPKSTPKLNDEHWPIITIVIINIVVWRSPWQLNCWFEQHFAPTTTETTGPRITCSEINHSLPCRELIIAAHFSACRDPWNRIKFRRCNVWFFLLEVYFRTYCLLTITHHTGRMHTFSFFDATTIHGVANAIRALLFMWGNMRKYRPPKAALNDWKRNAVVMRCS